MRCLKIGVKWVNLILSGKKTCDIRERIALGNTKTKCYVGYATIIDSIEMTIPEIFKHNNKHQANDFIEQYAKGRDTLFIWVLKDIAIELDPQPYSYSTG